jgi:hypothetical protein
MLTIFTMWKTSSVCAGLVTVDEESNIIRLVHYTTQEYFECVRLEWNPGAQEEMAVACLTYLSFNTFRSGSDKVGSESFEAWIEHRQASDKAFEQRLTEDPFFDYLARYWSEYVRIVESVVFDLALAFLYDEASVDCTTQGALTPNYKYEGYGRRFPRRISGLHLTARCGLLHLTERLLADKDGDTDVRTDSKDSDGETPLFLAAWYGHEAVVKLLLDTGKVEPDSKGSEAAARHWQGGAGLEE